MRVPYLRRLVKPKNCNVEFFLKIFYEPFYPFAFHNASSKMVMHQKCAHGKIRGSSPYSVSEHWENPRILPVHVQSWCIPSLEPIKNPKDYLLF